MRGVCLISRINNYGVEDHESRQFSKKTLRKLINSMLLFFYLLIKDIDVVLFYMCNLLFTRHMFLL